MSLQELVRLYHDLQMIPEPSDKIKEAIAKLEDLIHHGITSIKKLGLVE